MRRIPSAIAALSIGWLLFFAITYKNDGSLPGDGILLEISNAAQNGLWGQCAGLIIGVSLGAMLPGWLVVWLAKPFFISKSADNAQKEI